MDIFKFLIDLQNILTTNNKPKPMMVGFNNQEFKQNQSKTWFDEDAKVLLPLLQKLQKEFNYHAIGIIQKAAPGYNNQYIVTSSENREDCNFLQNFLEEQMESLDSQASDIAPQLQTGIYTKTNSYFESNNKEKRNASVESIVGVQCRVNHLNSATADHSESIYGFLAIIPEKNTKENSVEENLTRIQMITLIGNQLGLYFSHINLQRKSALRLRLKKTVEAIDTRISFLENPNDTLQILNDLCDFLSRVFNLNAGSIYTYIRSSNKLIKECGLDHTMTDPITPEEILEISDVVNAIKRTNQLDNSKKEIDCPIRYVFPLTTTFSDCIRALILFDSPTNAPLSQDEFETMSYRLKDKVGFHLQAAENVQKRISSISDFQELLKNISDPNHMQDIMIKVIANHLKVDVISYMEIDSSGSNLVFKKGKGQSTNVQEGITSRPINNSISGLAVKTGKTVFLKDIRDLNEIEKRFPNESKDLLSTLFQSEYETDYHTTSLLSVPLITGKGTEYQRVKGVINVNNKDNMRPFSEGDKQFLEAIASLVATGLDNMNYIDEKKQREILNKGAREIQMSLMPISKDFKRLGKEVDIFGESIPAKEVGGDLFEIVKLRDGRLLVIMGDVSGKGTPAALIMAIAQAVIKTLAPEEDNLTDILNKANKFLSAEMEGMDGKFVTLQLVAINLETGECELASAGHGPLFIQRQEGTEVIAAPSGMPLGLFDPPFKSYAIKKFKMEPKDLFVMFTDGLYEETSPEGEMFGMDRIKSIMQSLYNEEAKALNSNLIKSCQEWRGNSDAHDDLTVLSVKYRGKD